jgi:hypothetical protein
MLRWQQAEGRRHALEGRAPAEGGAFTALCGTDVTVERDDILELGGHWFDPTCLTCENAWLAR